MAFFLQDSCLFFGVDVFLFLLSAVGVGGDFGWDLEKGSAGASSEEESLAKVGGWIYLLISKSKLLFDLTISAMSAV